MAIYKQLGDLLLESGLGETATVVYIELLKLPAVSVWDLVIRTKLSKSSVYRAYDKLKNLKMITIDDKGLIKPASLKILVSDLKSHERKLGKLADKIKRIAPFLRAPKDSIEVFEQLYTPEQVADAYIMMSEIDYDVSLDFGDFENFVPILGDINLVMKFRKNRIKHATAYAICTTFGPNTALFCTREAKTKWKNAVDTVDIDYKKKFVVFSDKSDYVMFNDYSDKENLSSVLIKSKPIADFQRMNLDYLSQLHEKI